MVLDVQGGERESEGCRTFSQACGIVSVPGTLNQESGGGHLIATNHHAHWLDDKRDWVDKHVRTIEDSRNLKSAVPVDTWIHIYCWNGILKRFPYTMPFLLCGKVANLFSATSLYVKSFNAQNQHNILVVWVLLLNNKNLLVRMVV